MTPWTTVDLPLVLGAEITFRPGFILVKDEKRPESVRADSSTARILRCKPLPPPKHFVHTLLCGQAANSVEELLLPHIEGRVFLNLLS